MSGPRFDLRWRRPAGWQVTLAVSLFTLGFLVAVQLQSQGPRARYSTQERPPLVETALELSARQDALKERIVEIRDQIQELENVSAEDDVRVARLNDALFEARVAAGLVDLEGPGVGLQLEDAHGPLPAGANPADFRVQAEDLRDLLNALWLNGAEAVAINGERITVTTAITDIGGTVLVNAAYLAPPYVVTAIGPDDLYERVIGSEALRALVEGRVQPFGLDLRAGPLEEVLVPAFSGTIRLVEARPAPTATPAGAAP